MSSVVINLGELREAGTTQMITRLALGDKYTVDDAARKMRMTTSAFTRTVIIQAAEQVLAEGKKKTAMDPHRPPGGR